MSTVISTNNHPVGALVPVDRDAPPGQVRKEKLDKVRAFPKLTEWINQTCKSIEQDDKQERIGILKSQVRAVSFFDGHQFGNVDDNGNWVVSPSAQDPGFIQPKDNQFAVHCSKNNMEMCRSFVELDVQANDKSDSAKEEAAKFMKKRIEQNRSRINTAQFIQSENLSLLLKTITHRYTFFDERAGQQRKVTEYGDESKEGSQIEVCAICGKPKENLDEPETEGRPAVCGYCQSTRWKKVIAPNTVKQVVTGYAQKSTGRVETIHVDPLSVHLQLSARSIQSSKYLWWRQQVDRCELECKFPDRKIPSGKDDDRTNLETQPSNAWGDSDAGEVRGGEQFEKIPYDLIWIDRIVYENYVSQRDETLPDGRILPKGTKLTELCPDGMCVAKVRDTILDYYNANKNLSWTMCVYGYREHALHGSGTNAATFNQDTHNDFNAYIQANALANAARREFIRADSFEGNNLPTVTEVAVVSNLPEQANIVGHAYGQSPGSSLTADAYGYRENNLGSMQEQMGTSSLSLTGTSAQTEALGTATGIAAMRDLAVGRMGPNLMLKASMEEEHAYQMLELEQKNIPEEEWMKMAKLGVASQGDIGYSQKGIQAFIESNIREDFTIKAVNGSWMPVTESQEKANFEGFITSVGQMIGVPNAPPIVQEIIAQAAKTYNQPLQVTGWDANAREAARRLELLAIVVEKMERNLPDTRSAPPEILEQLAVEVLKLAPGAAMSAELDDHAAFQDFLKDWSVSDEGVNASPLMKKVVEIRHKEHRTGVVYQLGEEKKDAVLSEAPARAILEQEQMHQQEQAEAKMAEQAAMQEQQNQEGAQLEMAQYVFDKSEKEDDRTAQMEEKDKDRAHQVGLEAMRGVKEEPQSSSDRPGAK